jgi:hypothetical protein
MARSKNSTTIVFVLLVAILIAVFLIYRSSQPHRAPEESARQTRLGPPDIYPDPVSTPGAADNDITQDNIDENICNPDWSTKSFRPAAHYTNKLKKEQLAESGVQDTDPRDYEEDHLIPLEIGGNPTDPRNLWPEPYHSSIADGGAHAKDRVENYLHEQVCAHRMSLAEAQREIAVDWYRVYVTAVR